jgi:hypothetical protein
MTRSLTGKVALVTGAAKGIGAGIASAAPEPFGAFPMTEMLRAELRCVIRGPFEKRS